MMDIDELKEMLNSKMSTDEKDKMMEEFMQAENIAQFGEHDLEYIVCLLDNLRKMEMKRANFYKNFVEKVAKKYPELTLPPKDIFNIGEG